MSEVGERVGRAWYRHPLVAFARHRRIITFYNQLHSLIRAGIPLPTAFTQLQQYAPDEAMRRGLLAIARDVRNGQTLGEAMRHHAALFDDANVELLAFAEEAGRLEPVAAALIAHLERVQKQRWQALLASIWPLYLVAAAIFVGPLLGVAQQVNTASQVGGLYLSGLLSSLGWAVLIGGSVLGAPFLIAALDLGVPWDRLKRRLPVLGAPVRSLSASRFVLGLGLAMASGMEVVRALRLSARATNSPSVLADLPRAEQKLRGGSSLVEAVRTLEVLDLSSLGTLAVAETTGTLDETLEKLSKELEDSSLRAMRFLMLAVIALVAVTVLVKIIGSMLATLLGPVKKLYDAAGSGSLERD